MAASLTKIKGFIQTYAGIDFENISESESSELKSFLSEALSSLKWEMDNEVNSFKDEIEKRHYIFSLQSQLTYLADGVNGFEQNKETSLSEIFEWVLFSIFELLEHVRNYYSLYFNYEADLPIRFINDFSKSHLTYGADLIDKLEQHSIEPELTGLMQNFIEANDKSEGFKIKTWQHWDYLLKTTKAVSNFLENPPPHELNLELLKLLVSLEFNSIQVYAYFLTYIEKITLCETSYQEQQEQLLFLLKVFQQVRTEAYYLYDPKVQSLKTSVIESLRAELSYLEQKEKLQVQNFVSSGPETPSKFYFKVAVTLAELMFLFRVMLEVTFIQTKFKSYLYEFAYNHIQTDRAENMSKKSMRNHFNNKPFPDRIVRNIRNWLTKMIDHIDHFYKS